MGPGVHSVWSLEASCVGSKRGGELGSLPGSLPPCLAVAQPLCVSLSSTIISAEDRLAYLIRFESLASEWGAEPHRGCRAPSACGGNLHACRCVLALTSPWAEGPLLLSLFPESLALFRAHSGA